MNEFINSYSSCAPDALIILADVAGAEEKSRKLMRWEIVFLYTVRISQLVFYVYMFCIRFK